MNQLRHLTLSQRLIVMNLANKLHQDLGITTVLITHNLKDATLYGTRLIQLQEGKIARDLNTKDKTGLLIQEIYQVV